MHGPQFEVHAWVGFAFKALSFAVVERDLSINLSILSPVLSTLDSD
jgi:hypothetical protein